MVTNCNKYFFTFRNMNTLLKKYKENNKANILAVNFCVRISLFKYINRLCEKVLTIPEFPCHPNF